MGLKILAQTLPELQVPAVTDKEEDSLEAQYNGGIVNGNDELATVAPSPRVTSIIADVISMCDNCTANETENCTLNFPEDDPANTERNYWTLLLLLFPVFTVFGNILVLMSVYKERSLQTVTNYFIVSLAVADLLLASIVMPFAVYYLLERPECLFTNKVHCAEMFCKQLCKTHFKDNQKTKKRRVNAEQL